MIPRRIRLRNFLSYRDCTVDFSGLHMAVLSGKNGHGKSALIDGMTWALWGEARGGREDDRIRLGADEVLVQFEFTVENQAYQVVRKRTRGRTGSLDFFQVHDDGVRTSLGGATVTATQRAISSTLRMDFRTFVASAFMAQGRSAEFTKAGPADRKRVLGRILGLDLYERLTTEARGRWKESEAVRKVIEQQLEGLEQRAGKITGVEEELASRREERDALAAAIATAETKVTDLRAGAAAFAELGEAAKAARDRLRQAEERAAAAAKHRAETSSALDDATKLSERQTEIEKRYAELTAVREEDDRLASAQQVAQAAREAVLKAERQIAEERTRLESEAEQARRKVAELEALAGQVAAIEAERAALDREAAAIDELRAQGKELRATEASLREEASALDADRARLKRQAQEIKEKEAQLADVATCPVCQKPLGPEESAHVREEYAAKRRELGAEYEAAGQRHNAALAEADELRERVATIDGECENRTRAREQQDRVVHATLQQATDAARQLTGERERLQSARTALEAEAFAPDARRQRAEAQAAWEASGYDFDRHGAVRERLTALAPAEREHRQLAIALERRDMLAAQLARQDEDVRQRNDDVEAANGEAVRVQERLEGAEDVRPGLAKAEAALGECRGREAALTRQAGALEQQLADLQRDRATLESKQEELRANREQEGLYQDLESAFGRNGAQAMLIDQAIPRIQDVANSLLDRMSGRIQVELATQRMKADETMAETLDIRIRDEAGQRDYDLYSGGEAFRVDFALRIALARLLAERAGASLPTLIIDEGFGTQDREGIERLIESLSSIGDDFEVVLVVTHLEEMKMHFDRRIEVTKEPGQGSFATVV